MVKFEHDVKKMLSYDREYYMDFFDDDCTDLELSVRWYGFSLQLENIRNEKLYNVSREVVEHSIDILQASFKYLVSKLDQGTFWIVNHDDKDMKWFPDKENQLEGLKNLFKSNDIPNDFRGCLVLFKEELTEFAKDLIQYPYALSYKNLDVSHSSLPIILKITGHLTIDLLSTDKIYLNGLLNDSFLNPFVKVEYRIR